MLSLPHSLLGPYYHQYMFPLLDWPPDNALSLEFDLPGCPRRAAALAGGPGASDSPGGMNNLVGWLALL
jgi:hypothetical protein